MPKIAAAHLSDGDTIRVGPRAARTVSGRVRLIDLATGPAAFINLRGWENPVASGIRLIPGLWRHGWDRHRLIARPDLLLDVTRQSASPF